MLQRGRTRESAEIVPPSDVERARELLQRGRTRESAEIRSRPSGWSLLIGFNGAALVRVRRFREFELTARQAVQLQRGRTRESAEISI